MVSCTSPLTATAESSSADLHPQVEIKKGDAVEVEGEEIDGWLQVARLSDGARGLVPAWAVQFG